MLVGRIPFLRCTHRIAQHSTKATANYDSFKKLRAFPFETTPEEAQRTMGKAAVHICNKLGFLESVMAIFFPSSNILRPVRFSAAYFPAWIVNAEIEVDMKYGDTRRRGTLIVSNSYLPGSHIPTLSAAPLWTHELGSKEPVSAIVQQTQLEDSSQNELPQNETHLFDPSLLMQHGEEVQCIPFTTSPFSLLDVARNLPWSHAIINEALKFTPSSLKVKLFSAYPVLLPLYIAKYEMKHPEVAHGSSLTMWTQAHCTWSTMADNFVVKFHDERKAHLYTFGILTPTSPSSEVFSFHPPDDQVQLGLISFPTSEKAETCIKKWLQEALGSSTNISKVAATIDNDDDPRIRPMTLVEKDILRQYFENEKQILLLKGVIEKLESTDVKVIQIGLGSRRQGTPAERASASLQARLDSLLAKRKELKPQWWSEWESIQSQESP